MPLACIRLLDAIGIDPKSPAELRKLRETIRWADEAQAQEIKRANDEEAEARQRLHERRTRLYGLLFGVAATAIGSLVTWVISHTTIGFMLH